MILFPAIDVLDNRAVRLLYGKREMVTDYGNPVERAERWVDCGSEFLHVVDLNGAFDDSLVNDKTLKEMIKNNKAKVQIGGGIKSFDRVKYYIEEVGAARVIIGSACVSDRDMLEKAFSIYGEKIACGIDAMDGYVRIKGWVEKSDLTPIKLATDVKALGGTTIIYTDISRDGALSGINLECTIELSQKTGMDVIASGGLKNLEDIRNLKEQNIYGAILGRSIYTGAVDLREAIKIIK